MIPRSPLCGAKASIRVDYVVFREGDLVFCISRKDDGGSDGLPRRTDGKELVCGS